MEEKHNQKRAAPEILSVWWPCINSCASDPWKSTAAAVVAARMAMRKIDLIFVMPTSRLLAAPVTPPQACPCLVSHCHDLGNHLV